MSPNLIFGGQGCLVFHSLQVENLSNGLILLPLNKVGPAFPLFTLDSDNQQFDLFFSLGKKLKHIS